MYISRLAQRQVPVLVWVACGLLVGCDEGPPAASGKAAVESVAARSPGLREQVAQGVPAERAMASHAAFEKACRAGDVDALWELLADGAKADAVDGAASYRRQQPDAVLKKAPGYVMREEFGPKDYLAVTLREPDGLCPAGAWKLTHQQRYHELFLAVRHAQTACEALWFARQGSQVTVYPSGWYRPCPDDPAAKAIEDMAARGRALRAASKPVSKEEAFATYETLKQRCREKDVDALWAMLSDEGREPYDVVASKYRDIRKLLDSIGYHGPISEFDGKALLKLQFERQSLCRGVARWRSEWPPEANRRGVPTLLVTQRDEKEGEMCEVLLFTRRANGDVQVTPTQRWKLVCPVELTR